MQGLLFQREVHGAAFILLTWCSVGFLPAGCHGLKFYLSSGKPMAPTGLKPAGCHGLRFYLSSGKPMGQLSPIGCLPLHLSTWLPWYEALQLSTGLLCRLRGFTCPKGSPCGSFYLTSGLPIAMVWCSTCPAGSPWVCCPERPRLTAWGRTRTRRPWPAAAN
jgi:hypothetical protein